MDKIIGFLITKENLNPNIDFFNVNLNKTVIKKNNYFVHVWGIGNIKDCVKDDKYLFSFPLTDSLLDRNVVISFKNDSIIVENDWLGSIPVFYNSKEKIVSTISNFCLKDKTISTEGLENFCEFGYSVFEQTIFEDVKFMRYFSKLLIDDDGIDVEYKRDPVSDTSFLEKESTENEVIELMKNYISEIETKTTGEIIIPTSGGYDSRLLNYLVNDKSRIMSFTYGISKNQSQSHEVVHAKKISEIYGTRWEQIPLEKFHNYIKNWFEIYGFSTHLHGMYHIEFYSKILEKYKFNNPCFLSGIVGDAWAGSIIYKPIIKFQDIINLGYTHGMRLDLKYLENTSDNEFKKLFYEENKEYLKNNKLKAVFTIRLKLMLISYLTQIPEYFGMPVCTPFLNLDIVKATLNISEERRKNRIWQTDFFEKVGLDLENMDLKVAKVNKLDYEVAKRAIFEPINVNVMKRYISKNELDNINRNLNNISKIESLKNQILYIPKLGGFLKIMGFKNKFLKSLYEYYVIKAVEMGLKK